MNTTTPNGACVPTPESLVSIETNGFLNQTERLAMLVNGLEEHIKPVLSHEGASPLAAGGADCAEDSELVMTMRRHNSALSVLGDNLENIISRIQL